VLSTSTRQIVKHRGISGNAVQSKCLSVCYKTSFQYCNASIEQGGRVQVLSTSVQNNR
jgi:hypothetical protein